MDIILVWPSELRLLVWRDLTSTINIGNQSVREERERRERREERLTCAEDSAGVLPGPAQSCLLCLENKRDKSAGGRRQIFMREKMVGGLSG